MKMLKENNTNFKTARKLLLANGGNRTGEKIACVSFNGSVHPDQFWQNYSLGNITEQNLESILNNSLNIFKDKTLFAPNRCKKCRWLNLCGTNARFCSLCHSRESGNPKSDLSAEALAKAEWLLEPKCCLSDEEISITGVSNAEFACQDAKA
jgi:radical SAM protein with 4Fe4S-binding SPASM domain